MSVLGSTEDLLGQASAMHCHICKASISTSTQLATAVCSHTFHKSCLFKYSQLHDSCPACHKKLIPHKIKTTASAKTVTHGLNTRSQTQGRAGSVPPASRMDADDSTADADTPIVSQISKSPRQSPDEVQNLVNAAVGAQQAHMLTELSQQIKQLVETNIDAGLRRFSIQASSFTNTAFPTNSRVQTLPAVEQQTFEQLLGLPPNNNTEQVPTNIGQYGDQADSDLSFRPDKVGLIIYNWKVKFTGGLDGLSVENFIYRVEALTLQTLGGNFSLLCRYVSSLFDGKANDWFWRYHKAVRNIRWQDLCNALRLQYNDTRTDVDYREMIRDRKQRTNETFDSFYDSICQIIDRLSEPISEQSLVEILRRNLLPEIQHEILNLQIFSVSRLREICRKREFFLDDLKRRHSTPATRPNPIRKYVTEINNEPDILDNSEESTFVISTENDVSAISLTCWNCSQPGHRYQDCLGERKVFCYGCGKPNTYKPTCASCSKPKNLQGSAPTSARKPNQANNTN